MSNDNETVEIVLKLPGAKSTTLTTKISAFARVQHVTEFLSFNKRTKYYTNFSLLKNGKEITNSESISDIANNKSTINLQIQLNPYNTVEVLKHFLTVREYLGLVPENHDDLSEYGISEFSKFEDLPLGEIKQLEVKPEGKQDDTGINVSNEEKSFFLATVEDILDTRTPSTTVLKTHGSNIIPCVRTIIISGYNPVPCFYRTKGHILYLQIVTLEGETFHITAVPSGFFVNNSTANKFDPTKRLESSVEPTLYHLLAKHSKKFVSHVEHLEESLKRHEPATYARPVTTFLHKPWMVSSLPHNRIDFTEYQCSALTFHTERNFNDEFQTIIDNKSADWTACLKDEKLLARVIHDFNVIAVKGAMQIFHGDMIAINPDSPRKEQVFLKNNVFYSFIIDLEKKFSEIGGDDAMRASANQDLQTIQILLNSNMSDVRYLLTSIVEYCGVKILAQVPVPGILDMPGVETVKNEAGDEVTNSLENDVQVCYGQDDNVDKLQYNSDFDSKLQFFGKLFHLKPQEVEDIPLRFSRKSKGVVGSDKRSYILDLANTVPLDIEFVKERFDGINEEWRYPHRQTLLRHELIDRWWTANIEKSGLQAQEAYDQYKLAFNPDAYHFEGVEDESVLSLSKYLREEVIPELVAKVGDGSITVPYTSENLVEFLHKYGVNMRYLGRIIQLATEELERQQTARTAHMAKLQEENKEFTAWETSYLKKVEEMIKERQAKIQQLLAENKDIPEELREDFKLDESEIRKPHNTEAILVNNDQLKSFIALLELEVISRSIKHVFRGYSSDIPVTLAPTLVAYLFNLLFGSSYNPKPELEFTDPSFSKLSFQFTELTRETLLAEVVSQAERRFCHKLPEIWTTKYEHSLPVLVRAVSIKLGIQLLNKEYFFTKEQYESKKNNKQSKTKTKVTPPIMTFSINDFSLQPIVKCVKLDSTIADNYWNQGTALLEDEQKQKEALVLLTQAVDFREEIYGLIHPIVAESYLALSSVYSKLGMYNDASALCRKACTIFERVSGYDSFEMLRCLNTLALLEHSNASPRNSAICLKAALDIFSYSFPGIHPSLINTYLMLNSMAMSLKETKKAVSILKATSDLILAIDGEKTYPYALNESRIGNMLASLDDLNNSLSHIKLSYALFSRELGLNHQTTVQCKGWIAGIENILSRKQQQQKLAGIKSSVATPKGVLPKTAKRNKTEKQDAGVSSKSIDELVDFINSSGSSSKTSKGKKKKLGKK